jgi:hypothetical protein
VVRGQMLGVAAEAVGCGQGGLGPKHDHTTMTSQSPVLAGRIWAGCGRRRAGSLREGGARK